jgi:hypothetical protein
MHGDTVMRWCGNAVAHGKQVWKQIWLIQLRQTRFNHAGGHVLPVGASNVFRLLFNSHFQSESENNGIVAFLSRQCGGSAHENKTAIARVSACSRDGTPSRP